jgi:probable phosphoglycerate mutase
VVHPPRERTLNALVAPIPDGLDGALVLVRHGQSRLIAEGRFQGQLDSPLTAIGRAQAEAAGRRLAGRRTPPILPVPAAPPIEIVHSTLGRTAETAVAIAAAIEAADPTSGEIRLRGDLGFLEIAQGAWEGLSGADITTRYGEELAAWRRRPWEAVAPGGEALIVVAERVQPALTTMLASLADGRAAGTLDRSHVAGYGDAAPDHPWSVLVGHDGVFKVALLTLFGLPLERFWMWSMDLCGISVVEFRAGRPVLRAHNLTDHLAALQRTGSPDPTPGTVRPEGAL